jgi:pimeloyl-ACP methyl ester carboxylesterase/DNA-binding CsgD family transcriptional regulator
MSHPAQQIRFCTSRDGTRLAYATGGAGPPLFWIGHWIRHLEFDWENGIWRPWLSLLTCRHCVIRYDWRGFGLSDREGVEFSLEKHVEDYEAVVEAAGFKAFDVFGCDNGATAAVDYAARHPERVRNLVLWGAQSCGRLIRGMSSRQREQVETRLKLIEFGWPNDTPAYGQFFTMLHMPDASADQIRAYNELLRLTASPGNAVKFVRSAWEADVREFLPQVRCPTLVLHAREDAIVPFEEGRLVASLIPGARFVPVESRNNVLLDTEPAWRQLVEALDDFLPAPSVHPIVALAELTAREREVLELVAQGSDNTKIADRLKISEKTVRNHVSLIFGKLGVNSRAEAVARARDAGFGRRVVT